MGRMLAKEGQRFDRGDGVGYVATRDIREGDMAEATDFEPYGGAGQLVAGEVAPDWFMEQLLGSGD